MRHQRQLALANALFMDVQEAKERTGDASRSLLARAYARHLCASRPGCQSVILRLQQHLIPEPDQVRETQRASGGAAVRPVRGVIVHHARVGWRILVRQFLNDVAGYLAELTTAARRGWNAFFFSAADPTPVGLIRVVVGLLAFWSLVVFGQDLQDYFGSTGWADPAAIRTLARPLAWSFWFLVPDGLLVPVWLLCLVVLGLFCLGLFSRVTAVLSWVIVVSTARRVPIALYGFDQVLSMLLLVPGRVWSERSGRVSRSVPAPMASGQVGRGRPAPETRRRSWPPGCAR